MASSSDIWNIDNPWAPYVDWDLFQGYYLNPIEWRTNANYGDQVRSAEAGNSFIQFSTDLALARANAEWNAYPNQAKLMRQAGLNADLMGVSLGNSSASSTVSRPQNIPLNHLDGLQSGMSNLVSSAGSILDMYLSYRKNNAVIQQMETATYGQKLNNAQTEQDFALDYLLGNMTPEDIAALQDPLSVPDPNSQNPDGSGQLSEAINTLTKAQEFSDRTGLPLSVGQRFEKSMQARLRSPEGRSQFYTKLKDYATAKNERDKAISSPTWTDSYTPTDAMEAMTKMSYDFYLFETANKAIFQALLDPTEQARLANAQNTYTADVTQSLDPDLAASAQNSTNRYDTFIKDFQAILTKYASGMLRSGDALCKTQGLYIMDFVQNGTLMRPDQYLLLLSNMISAGAGNIITSITSGDWRQILDLINNGPLSPDQAHSMNPFNYADFDTPLNQ